MRLSMEQAQGERRLDRQVGVLGLSSATLRGPGVPACDGIRREPDGDVATPDERAVVLRPVADSVLRLVLRVDSGSLGRHGPFFVGENDVSTDGDRIMLDSRTNAPVLPARPLQTPADSPRDPSRNRVSDQPPAPRSHAPSLVTCFVLPIPLVPLMTLHPFLPGATGCRWAGTGEPEISLRSCTPLVTIGPCSVAGISHLLHGVTTLA